jgi:uncharacterized membrane protein
MVVFWYSGYRPERWFSHDEARAATLKRVGAMAMVLAVLSGFLAGVTVLSVETAATEQEITDDVRAVVGQTPDARLLGVDVVRGENPMIRRPTAVVATVGHPPGEEPPALVDRIANRLAQDGHDLRVEVRFVAVRETGSVVREIGPGVRATGSPARATGRLRTGRVVQTAI